jgi:CheY-specific phosphatase CheX
MSNYDRYSKYIARSVDHIFKNFLNDNSIHEVYETQSRKNDPKVTVEISGSMTGEIIINLPSKTLNLITRKVIPGVSNKSLKKHHEDVAGEIANLITGTFANQLQFFNHNIRLSAPDFNDDPIVLKTFYENINLSFLSDLGGFDVDLYYKEE